MKEMKSEHDWSVVAPSSGEDGELHTLEDNC